MNSLSYLKLIVKDELTAVKELVAEQLMLVLTVALIVATAIILLKPFPPSTIKMAVGDGLYHAFVADDSAAYLKQFGPTLEVTETSGSVENALLLADPRSDVQAALIDGGSIPEALADQIVALGSVAYEPVWVFTRKGLANPPRKFKDLARFKVGIGPELGATKPIVRAMMALSGTDISRKDNFVTGSFKANLSELKHGRLDAIIRVAGYFDQEIQANLRDSELELMSIDEAPAYQKKLRFLKQLLLPMDSVDLGREIPRTTISLIATSTTLAVKPTLHPDIQMLLLMSARDRLRSGKNLFFLSPGELPAYIDPSIPESPVASRFYKKGEPMLMDHLPYWLAGIIDRVGVLLIAAIALIYPIGKLNLHLRTIRYHIKHHRAYEHLLRIEKRLAEGTIPAAHREAMLHELASLNRHAISDRVPVGLEETYFKLLNAISLVRQKVRDLPA